MKRVPERLWDLPSAVLLTFSLLAASQRLYATNWTPGLETALFLTIFGVMLGLALGISLYKRWGVFWLVTGYSITLVPLVAGWILYHKTPWLERMVSLGGRLGHSLFLFITDQPVPDTALFIVFTGLGFWVISLLAGYALTRRGDFFTAVVPAGVVVFIIQLYDSRVGDRVIILAIYMFLCLILLGRMTYVRKRLFWKEQRVSISAESWTDLNLSIPAVALLLVILAWIAPANGWPIPSARVIWENITNPLQQTRKDLSNVIAGLQGNSQVATGDFYGSTLALGLHASVSENIYLNIRVPVTQVADRYYWRVRTYDQYLNNEWSNVDVLVEPWKPKQISLQLSDAYGMSSEFIFTATRVNLGVLVTPAHPIWVSRPSVVSFTPSTGESIDPLLISASPPILVGEQYTIHADIYNPTIIQLRQAGAIYPTWVTDRYMQLPENLSPQITDLAWRIIKDAETPYDKAIAITNFLRTSITYSTTVVPPPSGIDPLVWFLFDKRTGFCNYYATAEVILLRSVGVPTRIVVGFAQGEFLFPDEYIVREKDAHAWPEVYFPGIGWVEFEPTSSQPPLNRLAGDTNQSKQQLPTPNQGGQINTGKGLHPGEDNGASSVGGTPNTILRLMLFIVLIVIIIVGFALAYTTGLMDRILSRSRQIPLPPLPVLLTATYAKLAMTPPDWLARWAYYASLAPIERSFGVIYQSLRWLGYNSLPGQTPAEAAAVLMVHLPQVAVEIRSLTVEYEHTLFSRKHGNLKVAHRSVELIRRQAIHTAFHQHIATLLAKFQRLFPHKPE